MKKDMTSLFMWVAVIALVVIAAKVALDWYKGSKLEIKHKDGHTKIKYETPEHKEEREFNV